jgi:hypothetical protein
VKYKDEEGLGSHRVSASFDVTRTGNILQTCPGVQNWQGKGMDESRWNNREKLRAKCLF